MHLKVVAARFMLNLKGCATGALPEREAKAVSGLSLLDRDRARDYRTAGQSDAAPERACVMPANTP